MRKVFLFMGSYLPGTNSAGVTTSVSNMVEKLYPDIEFYILTADRDKGDIKPYDSVPLEQWTMYGRAHVYYSREYIKSLKSMAKIINSLDFDLYYINGFYNISDNARTYLLYFLGRIPRKPIIIAPRGIFSMGLFESGKLKRWVYRKIFSLSGLLNNVKFHATAQLEKDDILKNFPQKENDITIIPNISGITLRNFEIPTIVKERGILKAIFVSRISEKKNIKYILKTLLHVKGKIVVDIYGGIESEIEKQYWCECCDLIKQLPQNIKVNYCGKISHNLVSEKFSQYHLFYFPTYGENYGHVIAESLANGCPVLLSNMTPWNDVEKYNAGYHYPLKEMKRFIASLQEFVDMDQEEWNIKSLGAINYARHSINEAKMINDYVKFFS